MSKIIDRPCQYESIVYDSVPIPFGGGNCSMPSSECNYTGDIDISNYDGCDSKCPAYKPEPIDNRPYHTLNPDSGNQNTYCGIPRTNVKLDYYPTCKKCLKAMNLKED
jgi:hypothetical protein